MAAHLVEELLVGKRLAAPRLHQSIHPFWLLLFFSTSPIAANKNRVITTKNTKNAMRRFSAASKQVLLLPLLRNFAPEKNTSDAYNMVFLALLIYWGGEY